MKSRTRYRYVGKVGYYQQLVNVDHGDGGIPDQHLMWREETFIWDRHLSVFVDHNGHPLSMMGLTSIKPYAVKYSYNLIIKGSTERAMQILNKSNSEYDRSVYSYANIKL